MTCENQCGVGKKSVVDVTKKGGKEEKGEVKKEEKKGELNEVKTKKELLQSWETSTFLCKMPGRERKTIKKAMRDLKPLVITLENYEVYGVTEFESKKEARAKFGEKVERFETANKGMFEKEIENYNELLKVTFVDPEGECDKIVSYILIGCEEH